MTRNVPDYVPDQNIVHVYPIDDLREHDASSRGGDCWCCPEIKETEGGFIILHKSLDGREEYELGRRKLT